MNNCNDIVAVVGAGRMGIGIAQVFAYSGIKVRLIDAKERENSEAQTVLEKAVNQIGSNLEFLTSCNLIDEGTRNEILDTIECCPENNLEEAVAGARIVFEAVPEILAVKEKNLKRISMACDTGIIASTTSTFIVDTLGSIVQNPSRFVNTHWLNPAFLMPIVEVSPGTATSAEVEETVIQLLKAVGKVPVRCAPSPGFIVPRIQALAMNEAARLAEEGVASVEDIDKAARLGFGLRFAVLGLLEFIDWGGGDILYYASNYLSDKLESERFAPARSVVKNMEAGNLGMKTGLGFYDFTKMDVSGYQRETMKKFVDLLVHLGLMAKPGSKGTGDFI